MSIQKAMLQGFIDDVIIIIGMDDLDNPASEKSKLIERLMSDYIELDIKCRVFDRADSVPILEEFIKTESQKLLSI